MDPQPQLKWSKEQAQSIVRESYGAVVPNGLGVASSLYDPDEIAWLPASVTEYALGLGNPIRYADLQPGEIVLDIGSGAGIDTFLAAKSASPHGRVIGLDMTPEMLERARANQKMLGLSNVEFRRHDGRNPASRCQRGCDYFEWRHQPLHRKRADLSGIVSRAETRRALGVFRFRRQWAAAAFRSGQRSRVCGLTRRRRLGERANP